MKYVRPNIEQMTGYAPGEQPRGQKVIKLNTNENPYPPSPKVVEAIRAAAGGSLQRYPDALATSFRIAAADVLNESLRKAAAAGNVLEGGAASAAGGRGFDGFQITPDWILAGNGSDDILTIATRTFVGEGAAVRYPMPSYVLYKTLAEIQGAETDIVPFEADWSLGAEFVSGAPGAGTPRLAYLANPNSPSGTMMAPEDVSEIAAALPCPLLVDEAYVDFADSNCLSLVAEHDNVLVSRTLSKSYALAGLRFGYVVAQPALIEQLQKVKDSYNCDALSIAGATAAVSDQGWLAQNVARVRATRGRLVTAMRSLGFDVVDSQANFAWCVHPTADHKSLYEQLKSAGVLVRFMQYDVPANKAGGEGLRVSVGTDEQIDAFLSLLRPML